MKPDIYYFNPTCELAVANGSANYMAPAGLVRFEKELCTLIGLLAKPKDIVLVDHKPSQKYIEQLEYVGFQTSEYHPAEDLLNDTRFLSAKLGFLYPWGWSPAVHKLFLPFKAGCSPEFLNSPVAVWNEIHRELYSRKSSLSILKQILEKCNRDTLLSIKDLPVICGSHKEINSLQSKWGKVIVKSPWSASGRGLQFLRPNEYNQTNQQIIGGFLKQQGYVVAQPWHDKQMDLSFQFFSHTDGKIEFMGLTTFKTDSAGGYEGNFIQELPPDLQPDLKYFIRDNFDDIKNILLRVLAASNYSTDYYGWIGVDALIFRSSEGSLKFHPCLEINCRFTMGAIALKLRDHLAEGSVGEFRIERGKNGHFFHFCQEMVVKNPPIVTNGKIVEGFLPLTPVETDNCFGAFLSVNRK